MTDLDDYLATPAHDRYSLPGHDRDCARAMWSQSRIGKNPLSTVQVEHLLSIAWRAGATAEREAIYDGITDDAEEVFEYAMSAAQAGYSGDDLIEAVGLVYGPTLPWRRRVRLAARLALRKGYPR